MKKLKYQDIVKKLFNPDDKGFSRVVNVTEIKAVGIKWEKNGNMRHGHPPFDRSHKYMWNEIRKNPKNKRSEILGLQMVGLNTRLFAVKNNINPKIREYFRSIKICNFSLLPLNEGNSEIDHRWGYKNHPNYKYMQDISSQKVSDFQLIHKSLNLIKREKCKNCCNTKIRPAHPEKEFVVGTQKLDDINVCNGCYLAQPEKYRK